MKRFLIYLLIYGLWTTDYGLLYAQNAKVIVPADVTTQTTILDPQAAAPTAPVEGQIYYDNSANQAYYYDGTSWKSFGASKTVATKIVAVQRNPHDPALDSDLTNKTADYICDGTQDQVEIQQAIGALGTTGGVVYLLEGTYNIGTSFINLTSNTALIGAGAGTVLKPSIDTIHAKNVDNVLISQLMIDGNNSANYGIVFISVTNSKIDKVWAGNLKVAAISLNPSNNNNIISNNMVWSANSSGIALGSSSNNTVTGNMVWACGDVGINIFASNNTVTGNMVWSNSHGIYLNSGSFNTVTGNNIQGNTNAGIEVGYASNNNIIAGNIVWSNGLPEQDSGIEVSNSSNNTFTNNSIGGNGKRGIRIESSSYNNIVNGNLVYDNGGTKDYSGISLATDADNNLISSNLLYDSAGIGRPINIDDSTCNNNYIVGNLTSSWPANCNFISDAGTNTKYTDKTKITLGPASGYTGLTGGGTLTPTGPSSYLQLNPTGSITLSNSKAIADGKSAGDLLILENISSLGSVIINNNANVKLDRSPCTLHIHDILTLIWDGTVWVEVASNM